MIKIRKLLVILVFGFVLVSAGYAQNTLITGNAPSYAGMTLEFMKTGDWITGSEIPAGSCVVTADGIFSVPVNLETTRQIIIHLGIYLGYFFAEPGKAYQLILPEYTEKKPEDILNPYFQPEEIHLGLANFEQDELNMLIMMFEDSYGPYYDKHVKDVYGNTDMQRLEEDIQKMDSPFQQYPGSFFHEFRRYRYGMLKLLANQQKVQRISDEYFNNQPVLYNNPAYADLFNQVYNKYFIFFGRSGEGSRIYADINQDGSYRHLMGTLSSNTNFSNDTLKEIVILKQVHDEFYGDQFSRAGLLNILDTLIATSRIGRHRQIGTTIRDKITRLTAGHLPPQFELLDTNGNTVKLSDFKGRYVYLNFCTCQSYACLNEFNALADLYARHKERITILTIATDPLEEVLRLFLAKNKYDWKFLLYDRQPGVLKDYDIRAYPTYFLLGPDGKLILSPAPSPSENFESRLFEIMKAGGDL